MLNGKAPALRVAYLADQYPRREETFVRREIEALRSQGVGVETVSLWPPSAAESGEACDGPPFCLASADPATKRQAHARRVARGPGPYLRTLALAWRLAPRGAGRAATAVRQFSAAVVLAHRMAARRLAHLHNHATGASCTVALLASAFGEFEFSFTVHGPGVFFAPVERRLPEKLRRARFVRCISYFTRSQCLLWAPPERWSRLHVVRCGVDPAAYPVRDHRGPGRHLLFVGRLVPDKGLPILIDALARLRARRPAARLTIVGDGRERASVERRARATGVAEHVALVGYQTPPQVRDWLQTADVFVLPSLAEGVPVSLMEAMASGVPVVATRVGGVGELVEDGVSGFVVPAAAPGALAGRIEALLDDPGLRNRFGRAGRATVVREFDLGTEVTRLRGLFEWALEEHGGAPVPTAGMREPLDG
ncbi:MAG TPA: glycosyltransferase family 4 protein [Methylomirabilota bacterium]|nr:glycosyltransferase family 4 protein [Methylomirabilota bacterium]